MATSETVASTTTNTSFADVARVPPVASSPVGSHAFRPAASPEPLKLIAISTPFNSPIGIDYHEPTNSVLVSVNYSSGSPHTFERIDLNGDHVPFSNVSGFTDEVKIGTVRSGNPAGFVAGDLFVGNGTDGEIVRITEGGTTVINPWVSLPGSDHGLLRGALHIDRTGVFAGHLIVVTTGGEFWRIDAAGTPEKLADVDVHLEGATTVPDDPVRYGPLAGKIIAGAEDQGRLYAVDASGNVQFFEVGVSIEDIDIVPAAENFFGVNFGTGSILGAPASAFQSMVGDILLTQESPAGAGLFRLLWDGGSLRAEQLELAADSAPVGQWEHVTFTPAGIAEVPPVSQGPVLTVQSPTSTTAVGTTVLLTGNARAFGMVTPTDLNRIDLVTIGTQPVEVLDPAGNFFTRVEILPGDNRFDFTAVDALGRTVSASVTIRGTQPSSGEIDLTSFADITGSFSGVYGRTSFNEEAKLLHVDLATRNDGQFETDTPLLVGVKNLSDPTVTVVGADGFLPDGTPYYDYTQRIPSGMTVHPTLGIVVWEPTHEQVGKHQVVLRVRDGNGGIEAQTFVVEVLAENVAPVFSSVPGTLATAGQPYRYRLAGQDANGDDVRFRLDTPIPGMSIETTEIRDFTDPNVIVGRVFDLVWTPEASQVSDHAVTVTALDGTFTEATDVFAARGGATPQTFTLTVRDSSDNIAPNITSSPRETAPIGRHYTYLPSVENTDHDPLTYTVFAGPTGMAFDSLGALHWIPTGGQVGIQHVEIRVGDGRGGSDAQAFDVTVAAQGGNSAPVITSNPPLVTVSGREFRYDAKATDPDGDAVTWKLVSAPRGLSLDQMSGTLRWFPGEDQLGEQTVVLEAFDPSLASTTQRFTVDVRCHNTAPQIVSIPLTSAVVERNYLYPVRADDFEGDSVTFSLIGAGLTTPPAGMSIDALTGLIRWKPTAGQIGTNNVVVQVSDGGDVGTQAFSIVVQTADTLSDPNDPTSPPVGNRPPLVTSSPNFTAEAGTLYQYDVHATDPDGDAVTFSLSTPPNGMSIDATSGLMTWTPTTGDVGERVISVVATDIHGARATQSYLLSVTVNQPPSITSTPVTVVTAGATYRYTVKATDPDGDPLTFQLDQAPTGMSIDGFGRILWQTTAADAGTQPNVRVIVSDDHDETALQSFTLTVTADTTTPVVNVGVLRNGERFEDDVSVDVGSDVLFQVFATDNVAVTQITLTVNGTYLPLDASGRATFRNAAIGALNVVATATDAAGNAGEDLLSVTVVDPAQNNQPTPTTPGLPPHPGFDPTDNQHPIVEITSPAINATLTDLTPIIGTVDDPENNLWYYRVYAARLDLISLDSIDTSDPDWMLLNESTSEVVNGELARFDPSNLTNDPYAIIVAAYDGNGRGYVQPTIIVVEGNVQLGNFHLEFTDLSLPLAGIPITVTRVYDTLNAGLEGDFGFGWSLGVQDARILETVPANTQFIAGKTKVYLTNPAGRRVGFTFEPTFQGSWFGTIGTPQFTPDPGVYDQLIVDGQFGVGGVLGGLGGPFNPDTYTLVTKEGLRYDYSQTGGLQTITDLNGNVVTFTESGIQHSSGASIDFLRDHRGRIKEIRVPQEQGETLSLKYEYDAAGDLRKFTNQAGLTTSYDYLAKPAHFLDKAFDPLNRKALEVKYEDGRYVGVFDASGNQIGNTLAVRRSPCW